MKVKISPQRIYYYGENGHVHEFHGDIETNLYAPKGFPAYQIISDNFYVVNHNDEGATITDGVAGDVLIFKNHGEIEVVKGKEFQASAYGYGGNIQNKKLFENIPDFLNIRNDSPYKKTPIVKEVEKNVLFQSEEEKTRLGNPLIINRK